MRTLLLLIASVCFSTWLEPWFQRWQRDKSGDVLTVALGDSRKLFARHFYVKADAYFHNGYYPTIYDAKPEGELHMAAASEAAHADHEKEMDFLGKPMDWIDSFSRHFFPSVHTHLGEDECCPHCAEHDHPPGEECDHEDEHKEKPAGLEREMLPWFKLAATLDPERPDTYVVASFWLTQKLGKISEAEQFLREGLRANPGSFEILHEMGRVAYEYRKDIQRARNLWVLALQNFRKADPHVQS